MVLGETIKTIWSRVSQPIKLLTSGFFVAITLAVVARPNLIPFERSIRLFIIDFQVWQTLGITLIKVGIDQLIFVKISRNFDQNIEKKEFIVHTQVLNFLFCLSYALFNPFELAILLFLVLFFDLNSVIIVAELTGRYIFNVTVISNLLRNVLPYLVICLFYEYVTESVITLVILSGAILRFAILNNYLKKISYEGDSLVLKVSYVVIIQQSLNFLLFKIDNIIISTIRKFNIKNILLDELTFLYIYQRLPDIISGVSTTIAPILLPWIYEKYRKDSYRRIKSQYFILLAALFLSLTLVSYVYFIVQDVSVTISTLLVVTTQSVLIFIMNYLTYEYFAENRLGDLVKVLSISVFIGSVFFVIGYIAGVSVVKIIYIVPIQMISFILLTRNEK